MPRHRCNLGSEDVLKGADFFVQAITIVPKQIDHCCEASCEENQLKSF